MNKKKVISLLLCFIMGGVFICLFSYSTSILYPFFWGNDSAHFLTVGKAWYLGKIPYLEMFDHKGPIIYFIDMLGYLITGGNKAGVSFLQFIFMCFTLAGVFEISQLVKKSNLYGIIAVFITLCCMKWNYVEGNSVEEYCLPFLIWSTYGLVRWYNSERRNHDIRWTVLYGMTAGVCLMTRVTNFVPVCGGVFIICIYLIKEKKFKNFFANAGAFLIGFFVIVLPFVIYFAINGSFYDMLYDVLLFNIDYSKGCPSWLRSATADSIRNFSKDYFLYYIIFFIVGARLLKKDFWMAAAYLITAAFETYLFTNGYAWPQYPLVCLVQVVLLLNEIVLLLEEKKTQKFLLSIGFGWCLLTQVYYSLYESMPSSIDMYNQYHTYKAREWEILFEEIPKNELNSFVAYGNNEFKELYLLTNTMPCYKYYVIQEWISGFTDVVKKDVYRTFNEGNARWILAATVNTRVISDILENRYIIIDKTENYTLYRLADESD